MTRTIIISAAILAVISGPAMAEKCDVNSIIMDGIFLEGSVKCNEAWLDRSASLIEVERAKDCQGLPKKHFLAFAKKGIADFDRKLKELGHTEACKMLDESMMAVEKQAGSGEEQ